ASITVIDSICMVTFFFIFNKFLLVITNRHPGMANYSMRSINLHIVIKLIIRNKSLWKTIPASGSVAIPNQGIQPGMRTLII
ncbi:MAG TPA: hypothetical protein PK727_01130, partial [Bacteroidales bacterium]|nr:hypothetical protein [Bacteroidales bacterium]